MKTSKNDTKKKDWQKADARILGQILAAQNIDFVLPDSTHIAEFFAETLITIPGIMACRVCLHDVSIQRGEMEVGVCENCDASGEKVGTYEKASSFEDDFKCELAGQTGTQFNAIVSSYHHFGFFIFKVNDLDAFNVYKPFINNLANYVALSLENRLQRNLLESSRSELEFRVAERTKELRASNEMIKDLYNNAPCGYHSLDKDGLFILINDTELRWLGYSRDEIIGRVAFRDLLTANSLKTFEANFPDFKERGWASDLEFEMVRKDGTILPVLLNATAITDSDGNYVISRSTIFDMTERKRAEQALHESEERFRSFVEKANDIVYTVSEEGIFTYVSPNWKEVLGHEASEVEGKSFEAFVHPDDLAASRAILNRTIVSGEKRSGFEYRVKHKNGSWQWHTSNASVIRDANGRIVSFLGIARNITERKRNERELILLNYAINQSSDAVFLIDEQLTFAYVNDAACRSLGYTREELLTMRPSDIDADITYDAAKDIMNKQFINNSYPRFETRHKTRDGRIFPVEISSSVVEYDGAKFSLTTARDITERKRAEDALHERERHSQSLLRLSRNLERAQTYTEVLNAARDEVKAIVGYQNLWAYLLTEDKKHFKALIAGGPLEKLVMAEEGTATLIIQGDRMLEEIAKAKEIVVVEDARTDNRTNKEIVAKLGNRTIVNIPIFLFNQHLGSVGTGTFGNEGVRPPTKQEQEYLTALASHMAAALDRIHLLIERKQVEQSLRESEGKFRTIIEQSAEGVTLVDEQGKVIEWNQAYERMTGLGRSDVIGVPFWDIILKIMVPEKKTTQRHEFLKSSILEALQTGSSSLFTKPVEIEIYPQNDKEKHYFQQTVFPVKTENGFRIASLTHDVTDQREAEQKLKQLASIVESSDDAIISKTLDGVILSWNKGAEKIYGYTEDEVIGKSIAILVSPEREDEIPKILKNVASGKHIEHFETIRRRKDGQDIFMSLTISPIRDTYGNIIAISTIGRDITRSKQAEEALRKREQEFRTLAENSPDVIVRYDREGRRIYVNPEFERVNHLSAQEVQGKTPIELSTELAPKANAFTEKLMAAMASGTTDKIDFSWTKDGKLICWFVRVVPEFDVNGKVASALTIWSDISERKRAEDALRESETRFRAVFESSVDAIGVSKVGIHTFVNPSYLALFGHTDNAELIGKPILNLIAPSHHEQIQENIRLRAERQNAPAAYETRGLRKDGSEFDMDVHMSTYELNGDIYSVAILRDIAERKQHEREREAIIAVSVALRLATTRAEILNVLLEQLVDLFEADGAMLVLPNPLTGGFIDEMGRGAVADKMIGLNIPPGRGVCNWVITNKKPYLNNQADNDPFFYRPDLLGDSHCIASVPLIAQEQAIGALWIARQVNILEEDLRLLNAIADIAANAIHRVLLHEQTEQQLHHLLALHQIDIAISNNFDSNITLNVILNNVRDELEVDAASILLLDPITHTLNYSAGVGFKTHNIEQSHVKLGDDCAGRAAREYRTVSCPDLGQERGIFSRASLLAAEEFKMHYATPLVVKGQVKGVLELFHRKVFKPEMEWLSYFETLATQAAIALESASLLMNLQRSNAELMLAYDATIEGWSRALDLRDKETEGHTQRVANMALELADKMGMSNTEKQDLWRGALLHDIGKMGVPDSILLKPGHLTDDEWEVMRQHPLYAYQMLAPITYLRRALDISYCHHEKWDGSGYPRGLKGEEIPFAARVFAVVDVYDALISERPYRIAWTEEQVYRYIQEQAGKHFDPQIVKIFLESRGSGSI